MNNLELTLPLLERPIVFEGFNENCETNVQFALNDSSTPLN